MKRNYFTPIGTIVDLIKQKYGHGEVFCGQNIAVVSKSAEVAPTAEGHQSNRRVGDNRSGSGYVKSAIYFYDNSAQGATITNNTHNY